MPKRRVAVRRRITTTSLMRSRSKTVRTSKTVRARSEPRTALRSPTSSERSTHLHVRANVRIASSARTLMRYWSQLRYEGRSERPWSLRRGRAFRCSRHRSRWNSNRNPLLCWYPAGDVGLAERRAAQQVDTGIGEGPYEIAVPFDNQRFDRVRMRLRIVQRASRVRSSSGTKYAAMVTFFGSRRSKIWTPALL